MLRGQLARFVVAGAANTLLTVLLFEALRRLVPHLVAYTLAYAIGIVVAYALGTGYVFRRRGSWPAALRFPLVYLAQYLFGAAGLWLLVDRLGADPTVAICIVVAASVPLTFLLSRRVLLARSP